MLKSFPSTTESWNLRQGISISQNKVPCTMGGLSVPPADTLGFTSGLQPDVSPPTWTSYKISPYATGSREALSSGWLLMSARYALDLGGCWGSLPPTPNYVVYHQLTSFTHIVDWKSHWKHCYKIKLNLFSASRPLSACSLEDSHRRHVN